MAAVPPPPGTNPVLQKPPGYRDPSAPAAPPPAARPPPRKQPLPPSFRPVDTRKQRRRPRRSCCCRFCCWCFLLFFILLFLLAIAGALSYLYFEPKLPSFHIQSLKFTQLRVSVKPDGSFLDSAASAAVQLTNPNSKIAFSYKQGEVKLSAVDDDGEVGLGSDTFPELRLGKRNSTVVRVKLGVKGVMVDDAVGSRLKSRFQSKELKFVVEFKTKFGVGVDGESVLVEVPAKVVCGDLSLKEMGGGGALPKCTINLFRWINLK